MSVGLRGERCIATEQYHRGALRILRPHYLDGTAQVCYVVVNPGGAYLGGDRYGIDVEVQPGARLLLTTQSATKIYRTPGSQAEQSTRIRLGAGASLESIPDQLIAYRGASYRQNTVVEMAASSSLVMAEVVTPGWSPDGALFGYDTVRLRTDISVDGRLVVLDNLQITPAGSSPVDGMAFLEHYTHLGSLLVVDQRVDAALVDELHDLLSPLDPDGQLGISLLAGPGLVVRALSNSTEPLNALIAAATDLLRARWHGQGPMNLRKY
ncbi:urease accessory protein UreD [Pseudarthrobacter sp. P1]|uniref:urease accessory protein UreD n=1 Tax=Pseudarthrobacter sp. P1 TaxID=3418418 RepID=UPI003CEA1497